MVYDLESQFPLSDDDFEQLQELSISAIQIRLKTHTERLRFYRLYQQLLTRDLTSNMTDDDLAFLDHLESLDRPYTKDEQERIFAMTGGPRIGGPTYYNFPAEIEE